MNDLIEKCWEAYQEYQDENGGACPDFLILGSNLINEFASNLEGRFATEARRSREYRMQQYMGCQILCSFSEPDAISFAHNPFTAGGMN